MRPSAPGSASSARRSGTLTETFSRLPVTRTLSVSALLGDHDLLVALLRRGRTRRRAPRPAPRAPRARAPCARPPRAAARSLSAGAAIGAIASAAWAKTSGTGTMMRFPSGPPSRTSTTTTPRLATVASIAIGHAEQDGELHHGSPTSPPAPGLGVLLVDPHPHVAVVVLHAHDVAAALLELDDRGLDVGLFALRPRAARRPGSPGSRPAPARRPSASCLPCRSGASGRRTPGPRRPCARPSRSRSSDSTLTSSASPTAASSFQARRRSASLRPCWPCSRSKWMRPCLSIRSGEARSTASTTLSGRFTDTLDASFASSTRTWSHGVRLGGHRGRARGRQGQ